MATVKCPECGATISVVVRRTQDGKVEKARENAGKRWGKVRRGVGTGEGVVQHSVQEMPLPDLTPDNAPQTKQKPPTGEKA